MDNGILKRNLDVWNGESYDLRKDNDHVDAKNADLQVQIRSVEIQLKEREDMLFVLKREIDALRLQSGQQRDNNLDLLAEKEALEKHAQVLSMQN